MPDIPDQFVHRRVEHGMDRHGQFNNPKRGPKMPARLADRLDRLAAQFLRKRCKLSIRQSLKIGRPGHTIKCGGGGDGDLAHGCVLLSWPEGKVPEGLK